MTSLNTRRTLPITFCLLAAAVFLGTYQAAAADDTLRVMSYNLRYASTNPPNAWPQRRPLMRQVLEMAAPDLMGTQEGLRWQLDELASDLPGYSWIGTGRDGGDKGEFMAIFYRQSRLQPLSTNHFWLSDTPEIPASSTWGNSNRRMVTWVRFRDLQTKREFYHFNTHFDHQIQRAREKSAELVRQRMANLQPTLPIILTGDFNAGYDNASHQILVKDGFLVDTWDVAKEVVGRGLGTFNSFKAVSKSGERIDWILVRGITAVDKTEIITTSLNGQFPSDHCPLEVWLKLPE